MPTNPSVHPVRCRGGLQAGESFRQVKIKSAPGPFARIVPTRNILDSLGRRQNRQLLLIGFAAETNDVEENAAQKMREKNCDIMVANERGEWGWRAMKMN